MGISKKLLVPGALVTVGLAGVLGGTMINGVGAHAATDTTSAATTTATTTTTQNKTSTPPAQMDPTKGGHVGTNGTKEELLTGDTAAKVKAAALAAVPGGTVQRVENDAEGATYEAHVTKSDGSQVTVKFDANFKVTSTEDGMK